MVGWARCRRRARPRSARAAVLERLQVVRRAIGGEHDLPAAVVEGVEGVKELLLGPGLALEELDVVEEQDVDVAEARLEALGLAAAEGAEELVREGLAGRAADGQARVVGEQEARDRAQQVGLADSRRTADEERVVGLRGHLGDRQRGGVGEPVAVADDELVEGELGVAQRPAERTEVWARGRFIGPAGACAMRSPPRFARCVRALLGGLAGGARVQAVDDGSRGSTYQLDRDARAEDESRRCHAERRRSGRGSIRRRAAGPRPAGARRRRSGPAAARARCGRSARRRRVQALPAPATICAPARRSRQRLIRFSPGESGGFYYRRRARWDPVRRL